MNVTTIGIDLVKHVFQVHAVDAAGKVIVRKALHRAQVLPFLTKLSPCLVGMEACGTSHHWARELIALGHTVKMMPPAYVKAYVKLGKTDAADAEAICEVVTRPTMRLVARAASGSLDAPSTQSPGQTAHPIIQHDARAAGRVRHQHLRGSRTCVDDGARGTQGQAPDVPAAAVKIIFALSQQSLDTHSYVREIDRALAALQRSDDMARRLATIPGIGPIGATALGEFKLSSQHLEEGGNNGGSAAFRSGFTSKAKITWSAARGSA